MYRYGIGFEDFDIVQQSSLRIVHKLNYTLEDEKIPLQCLDLHI